MGCTDRLVRRFPFISTLVSPLTCIARAIYETQTVSHIRQGFNQPWRLPQFFNRSNPAAQTTTLVEQSLIMNGVKYLVPVIMAQRAVYVAYEKVPPQLGTMIYVADWILFSTILLRLFLRSFWNNTLNFVSLPRAISNDVAEHLSAEISDGLALGLAKLLSQLFCINNESQEIYQKLFPFFKKKCQEIFLEKTITKNSFWRFQTELAEKLIGIIDELEFKKVSMDIAKDFSYAVANMLSDELSSMAFATSSKTSKKNHSKKIIGIIGHNFFKNVAALYVKEFTRGTSRLRHDLQSFVAANNIKSCGCGYKKQGHALVSSYPYYAGNIGFTYLAELVEWLGYAPKYLIYAKALSWMLRALLYGQNLFESKLSEAGQCTKHRYLNGARNKAFFFGMGTSFFIQVELMAFMVKTLTEVDNIYSRNAINNFLLFLHSIPTFAFNDPLPGKKKHPFDLFLPVRKGLYYLFKATKSWIAPDLYDPEERSELEEYLKRMINSREAQVINYFIFGPSEFFPFAEYANVKKMYQLGRALPKDEVAKKELIKLERQMDVVTLLYENPLMRLVFRLYAADIQAGIYYGEKFKTVGFWFISMLPIEGVLIAVFLQSLDKNWQGIIKKTNVHLVDALFVPPDSKNILDLPEVKAKYAEPPKMLSLFAAPKVEVKGEQDGIQEEVKAELRTEKGNIQEEDFIWEQVIPEESPPAKPFIDQSAEIVIYDDYQSKSVSTLSRGDGLLDRSDRFRSQLMQFSKWAVDKSSLELNKETAKNTHPPVELKCSR